MWIFIYKYVNLVKFPIQSGMVPFKSVLDKSLFIYF